MDPELLIYLSGGFFSGAPAAVPEALHGTLAAAQRHGFHHEILGLWLHPEDAELLLEEERPIAPARRPTVQQHLQHGLRLGEIVPDGAELQQFRLLGFQVLGFEENRAWTWTEAGLVAIAAVEIDHRCDGDGVIPDRGNALSASLFLNHEDLGPPVIWRPWLLSTHRPRGG